MRRLGLSTLKFGIASLALGVVAAVSGPTSAQASCPPPVSPWLGYGNDTCGPTILITIGPSGTTITNTPWAQGPYDGIEDTYLGVVNNSGSTVFSIPLSSPTNPIFGFDSDGLAIYGAPTPYDPYGYGGPLGYFTNISGNSGVLNFTGGLANGATTYFSLEDRISAASIGGAAPEASTWAMMLLGFVGLGWIGSRARASRRLFGSAVA